MCKYEYKLDFRSEKCKIVPNLKGCNSELSIPYDSDNYCIFHSKNLSWKRNFDINKLFKELILTYQNNKISLYFNGFVLATKSKNIELIDLKIKRIFTLEKCEVIDDFLLNNVLIENGTFKIDSCEFKKSLTIKDSIIEIINIFSTTVGRFYLQNNKFTYGQALFNSLRCNNDLKIENCHFEFGADFRNSRFLAKNDGYYGELVDNKFSDVSLSGEMNFSNTLFNGAVIFENCNILSGGMQFIGTVFSKSMATKFVNFKLSENTTIQFNGTDESGKIFSSDVYFSFDEDDIKGKILFENVNVQYIKESQKQKLFALQRKNKVLIGRGCLKYRVQSEIKKIDLDGINNGIAIELANTFSHYFIRTRGYNLGVEFLSKEIHKLELFYFSDEDLTHEMFSQMLKDAEKGYWDLENNENGLMKVNEQIHYFDNRIEQRSLIMKMKVRNEFGVLNQDDLEEIAKVLSFKGQDFTISNINLIINKSQNNNIMNINKVISKSGGIINFYETFNQITYESIDSKKFNKSDFESIKNLFLNLKQEDIESIRRDLSSNATESLATKIKTKLEENSIPISQSLSAAVIFEIVKVFLGF